MRHIATTSLSALLAVLMLAAGPARAIAADNLLLNGGAEQGKGDQPSIWFAAQVPAQGLRMWRDTTQVRSGQASLAIANQHDYDQPVSNNWAQQLQQVPVGKTLQLVAYVRTADADAANICLQCWDKTAGTMLAFASTPVVRGDQDWIQLKSEPVVVPEETASILVRAALTGKGEARFDDVTVTLVDADTSPTEIAPAGKTVKLTEPKTVGSTSVDPDLAGIVPGYVVAVRPVIKDTMVLTYISDWGHGNVDNIAVANNQGGVRTLLAWLPVTPEQIGSAGHRFYLAIYSRDTHVNKGPGTVGVYAVKSDWNEETTWKTQPQTDKTPVSNTEFAAENGWKVFDVTPIVNAKTEKTGVLLRFDKEDRDSATWSGYQFVSREGAGEWKSRRPVLLVVEPTAKPAPQTQKGPETSGK